jgi:hypothetical protein
LPSITFIKMAKKRRQCKRRKNKLRETIRWKVPVIHFLLGGVFLISIRNQKSQRFRWATAKKRDKSKWRRRDGWPSHTDTEPCVWLNWPFFFYFYYAEIEPNSTRNVFRVGTGRG